VEDDCELELVVLDTESEVDVASEPTTLMLPLNITAAVVTKGEAPSKGDVGTAIAGDTGDVGIRV